MKKLLFALAFFYCNGAFAQSPGLIVNLTMDSLETGSVHFKMEMKICEPVSKSKINGYFTNDSSTIDFKKLTEKDIICGMYIDNYKQDYPFYNFRYGNQVFAWEKIVVWKIMNISSRALHEPMYIILPVKIKSFVTYIEIKDIEFEGGKFIWLDKEGVINKEKTQHLLASLKNRKGIDTDKCSLKKILN
jgi:hypothetical protein